LPWHQGELGAAGLMAELAVVDECDPAGGGSQDRASEPDEDLRRFGGDEPSPRPGGLVTCRPPSQDLVAEVGPSGVRRPAWHRRSFRRLMRRGADELRKASRRSGSVAEQDDPVGKSVHRCGIQVGEVLQLRNCSESTELAARLDNGIRLLRRQPQVVGQHGCRHVIDVDQAAVVELPGQVGTADPQVAGERRIAVREHVGMLAALGGGDRSGDRRIVAQRRRQHRHRRKHPRPQREGMDRRHHSESQKKRRASSSARAGAGGRAGVGVTAHQRRRGQGEQAVGDSCRP